MIPRHIAIIPDGNRRWAKALGLPAVAGHKKGFDQLKEVGEAALARGVEYCTVFAFSTENWKRTADEVGALMDIFISALTKDLSFYLERGIRVRVLGERAGLSDALLAAIVDAEARTKDGARGQLNMCINYGGRLEILEGVKRLLAEGVSPDAITEEALMSRMWSDGIPDPDIILRTSGEHRLSGFLTWSGTYSELFFVEKNWPDFTPADLNAIIDEFEARERRFGK